jgi:diaminohydroxyphosphoribosylaminopyrimidine deaminase/5-amino-6-(5-phosphoribosylamino)uracil reductase
MTKEENYIYECIKLAEKGIGYVSPNPLVGSIVVKNGKIIGKGYHKKFGENHAEINAINNAKKQGFKIAGASLYVNLEPCSHFGKTPPCVDEIIKNKIKKVFIGIPDPNPLVNGKGIKILKQNGIEVKFNILKNECSELNKFYIKFITKKQPYVTLKVAQSIDGKIALNNNKSKWITSESSRKLVYNLRGNYDAVLIGKNTADFDNPSLTTHSLNKQTPKRFVFDHNLSLKKSLKIFTDEYKDITYLLTSEKKKNINHFFRNIVYFKETNGKINLGDVLKYLYKSNISSLLVEGGADIFSQFLENDLFDDIYFFIAPKIIGQGISSFSNYKIDNLTKTKNLSLKTLDNSNKDIILNFNKLIK